MTNADSRIGVEIDERPIDDASRPSTETERPITDAERVALGAATQYARAHDLESPPETAYLAALPGARRSIRRRLVGGLLRGRPAGLPAPTIVASDAASVPDDAEEVLREIGIEELAAPLRSRSAADGRVATLPFPRSEAAVVAPVEEIHGFDRYRLGAPIAAVTPDGSASRPHPVAFVPLLAREGAFTDDEQAARFGDELGESVANLALARVGRRRTDDAVDADGRTILDPALRAALPGADGSSAVERLAVDGHPFHPGAKIRRGMTPGDGLAYAPSSTDRIDVRFVAVARTSAAEVHVDRSVTRHLYDRFDGLRGAVERSLPAERDADAYAVVPCHPWQFHTVVPDRYGDEIERGRVVPVRGFSWPATPLSNLRTVVPFSSNDGDGTAGRRAGTAAGDDGPVHLKLAVDAQLTNVVRTVSPHAVHNGPRVTSLFAEIRGREQLGRLGVCDEPAATCFYPDDGPHPAGEGFDDARNLSALVRRDPTDHPLVSEGTVPIAVGSLLARSPVNDRPVVRGILDRFGSARGDDGASAAAAEAFVRAYVDAVVPDQLRLCSAYGVALESHPQNTLVVFDEGRPAAALVRDFGGIRVLDDRLEARGLALETYPDSDLAADAARGLHEKLYYALFQNHLTELFATLTRHAPIDESTCWTSVAETARETFERLRADPGVPDAWVDRDEAALFADPMTHKALTAMRLRGKRHEYVRSRVSNPLARVDG